MYGLVHHNHKGKHLNQLVLLMEYISPLVAMRGDLTLFGTGLRHEAHIARAECPEHGHDQSQRKYHSPQRVWAGGQRCSG